MNGGTILLVDDDENDAVLFTEAMRDAGFKGEIRVLNDGSDVIPYLSSKGVYGDRERFPMPTLVLLDIRMRNVGGLETLRKVRELGVWADIPIAVLCGASQLPEVNQAYKLGARTFFMKPVQRDDAAQICEMAGQGSWVEKVQRPGV